MQLSLVTWYLMISLAAGDAEEEIDISVPPEGYFHITLLAYTGLRDPVWSIAQYSNSGISHLLLHAKYNGYVYDHACIPSKTGYKGFLVHDATGEQLVVGPQTIQLQLLLLDSMPCELPPRGDYREGIRRTIEAGSVSADCSDTTGNKIVELPSHLKPWSATQNTRRKNNGYNYVKGLVSNSFAQPGRVSGNIYSKVTGDEIKNAAIRDGLLVLTPHPTANETIPANPSDSGYMVALFVAPGDCNMGGDFHWYRLDVNGTWSHKPGQSSATDLDDAKHIITDPRTADTGVYIFVCFMVIKRNAINSSTECQEGASTFDQCKQLCQCVGGRQANCCRTRKEFTSMTFGERTRYIRIIKTASTDAKIKNDYNKLIDEHRQLFLRGIHSSIHFLTWHRYFMLRYENLRRVDCRFTIAYWDWSAVSKNPFSTAKPSDLWHSADTGFGGNGVGGSRCVKTGPFSEDKWSLVPPGPRCLSRNFNGNTPDAVAVEKLLTIAAAKSSDFELGLRVGLHNLVHVLIGGTMNSDQAADAPEFFLHHMHGFIDKIWNDWQKKSKIHKNALLPNVNNIFNSEVEPKEVIDLASQPGGVGVKYQPNPNLNSNTSLPRQRYSSLNATVFQLFNLTQSEITRARELEEWLKSDDANLP